MEIATRGQSTVEQEESLVIMDGVSITSEGRFLEVATTGEDFIISLDDKSIKLTLDQMFNFAEQIFGMSQPVPKGATTKMKPDKPIKNV